MVCTVPGHRELGMVGRLRVQPPGAVRIFAMCRLFGAAASAPIDVSFELLRSDNSILRQSERHDSGWGSAYYSAEGCRTSAASRRPPTPTSPSTRSRPAPRA